MWGLVHIQRSLTLQLNDLHPFSVNVFTHKMKALLFKVVLEIWVHLKHQRWHLRSFYIERHCLLGFLPTTIAINHGAQWDWTKSDLFFLRINNINLHYSICYGSSQWIHQFNQSQSGICVSHHVHVVGHGEGNIHRATSIAICYKYWPFISIAISPTSQCYLALLLVNTCGFWSHLTTCVQMCPNSFISKQTFSERVIAGF